MDAEAKLAALWNEANPPARDPAFALAVMERVERRRMWLQLLERVPLVSVVGVLAWAFAPAVETVVVAGSEDLGQIASTGVAVALSLLTGVWLAMGSWRARFA